MWKLRGIYSIDHHILTSFYMPDTVLNAGDTKVTKAIMFDLKDLATRTVKFEHCKESTRDEMSGTT